MSALFGQPSQTQALYAHTDVRQAGIAFLNLSNGHAWAECKQSSHLSPGLLEPAKLDQCDGAQLENVGMGWTIPVVLFQGLLISPQYRQRDTCRPVVPAWIGRIAFQGQLHVSQACFGIAEPSLDVACDREDIGIV